MVKRPKQASNSNDERSAQETERIREQTLKRILSTPPKRHDEMIAERKTKRSNKTKKSSALD